MFQVLSGALYVMIGHHGTLLEITHSTTVATVMQSIKGIQMKLLHICPQWTPHHHHHHDKDQGANILARNHFDRMSLPDQWPLSCTHRAVILLYCTHRAGEYCEYYCEQMRLTHRGEHCEHRVNFLSYKTAHTLPLTLYYTVLF